MDSKLFIEECKKHVAESLNEEFREMGMLDIEPNDVYVVWSVKVLKNNKALLSTDVADGWYYELTFNGHKNEMYFDSYKKVENKKIEY